MSSGGVPSSGNIESWASRYILFRQWAQVNFDCFMGISIFFFTLIEAVTRPRVARCRCWLPGSPRAFLARVRQSGELPPRFSPRFANEGRTSYYLNGTIAQEGLNGYGSMVRYRRLLHIQPSYMRWRRLLSAPFDSWSPKDRRDTEPFAWFPGAAKRRVGLLTRRQWAPTRPKWMVDA